MVCRPAARSAREGSAALVCECGAAAAASEVPPGPDAPPGSTRPWPEDSRRKRAAETQAQLLAHSILDAPPKVPRCSRDCPDLQDLRDLRLMLAAQARLRRRYALSAGGCDCGSGARKAGGAGDGDEGGTGGGCGSSKRGGRILNGASSPIAPEISRITVLLASRSSRITLPTARITWGKSSGGMTISAITRNRSISKIPKNLPSANRPGP